eukprot:3428043-Lingulodinium_polyedra.AAC.1
MAQTFEGFLLICQRDRRRPRQNRRGWAPRVLELRAEGLDCRNTGAEHLSPQCLGAVPGHGRAALRIKARVRP